LKIETNVTSLHYGANCFEGLSIARNAKTGKVQSFMSDVHMKSFLASALHLTLPPFDVNELFNCMKRFVTLEKGWFPQDDAGLLYVRLCHISTEATLGVRRPKSSKIFALICPDKLNYKHVKLTCNTSVNKNWPMGHGKFKIGSNYGPLIPHVREAMSEGYRDIMWLNDHKLKETTS